MLELYQTEWCPASHRVRQRLTELGLECLVRQVPVEREQRFELAATTGQASIPALVDGPRLLIGEQAILDYLNSRYPEPTGAHLHCEKAAKARKRDLEEACKQLTASTR
jgi:glutathione S-transferase